MGKVHWKDGRSAKELAQSWLRGGSAEPPDELVALLDAKFGAEITVDEAKPECIIELDDFVGEHRNCDLVVLCNVGAKRMVISVEAKADEAFGDVLGYYDRKANFGSNVPTRIRPLSLALLGRELDEEIRKLRYRLIHAAAATLIEAKKNGAELALFLVHKFRSASLNSDKLMQKCRRLEGLVCAFPELATAQFERSQILGPVSVSEGGRVPNNVPLYLGKLVTELKLVHARYPCTTFRRSSWLYAREFFNQRRQHFVRDVEELAHQIDAFHAGRTTRHNHTTPALRD